MVQINNHNRNQLVLPTRALVAHGGHAIREQLTHGVGGTIRGRVFENQYVTLVFRLVLAGTFLLSSIGKLVDIEQYSVAMVYNFDLLPGALAIGFGWAIPFIELACAVGLLLGVQTRLSALGIALMSASFFVAKVILLSRGVDVECGCFGAVVSTMASWSIYLDPAILLLSVTVLFSSRRSRQWVSLGIRLPEEWSNGLNLVWWRAQWHKRTLKVLGGQERKVTAAVWRSCSHHGFSRRSPIRSAYPCWCVSRRGEARVLSAIWPKEAG